MSGWSVNYQLPLLYPDLGLFGITYFQRVRLNAFYDRSYRTVDQFNFNDSFGSVGGQLFFDNVWLNTQDITVGIQAAYRLDLPDTFTGSPVMIDFLLSGGF